MFQDILDFIKQAQERVLSHMEDQALLKAYIAEWRKFFTQCGYLPMPFGQLETALQGKTTTSVQKGRPAEAAVGAGRAASSTEGGWSAAELAGSRREKDYNEYLIRMEAERKRLDEEWEVEKRRQQEERRRIRRENRRRAQHEQWKWWWLSSRNGSWL